MRILHLVTCRQHRGAEVFAAQLADGLVREGHQVLVAGLFTPPADPLVPSLAPVADLGGRPGRKLSYSLVSEVARLIRRFNPDVVQANGSATLKYTALARVLLRGRWPLVYRNISIASQWVRNPAHLLFGQWLVRNVTHVVAVSRLGEEDFSRTYRVPPARISTIPIGVHIPSTPRLPALRPQLAALAQIPPEAELVIHVGSFSPEKNHLWLLDAFAGVLERRPEAHLLLVGDGPLRGPVETEIVGRGLQQRIHLLGTRSDVPTLVGGADLLVLPSTIEGIPGVILEAAAQAVPAVATDVGGVAEAVDHGESGLLVKPGDLVAFAGAVCTLLEDAQTRNAMGNAAYRLVKERYSMDSVIARFGLLYEDLCQEKPDTRQLGLARASS